jgi:5-formyltetrahydrofolate cyclo-ligase
MNNTKPALRTLYLEKRKALETDSHEDLSFSIANQCLKLPIWDYQYFHLYLPLTEKAEIDTTLILTLLQGRDKAVFVPKIKSEYVL